MQRQIRWSDGWIWYRGDSDMILIRQLTDWLGTHELDKDSGFQVDGIEPNIGKSEVS